MKRIVASSLLFAALVLTGLIALAAGAPEIAIAAAFALWGLREALRKLKRGGGPVWRRFKAALFISPELAQLTVRAALGVAGAAAAGLPVAAALAVTYVTARVLTLHVLVGQYNRYFRSDLLAAGFPAVAEYRTAARRWDTTSAPWVERSRQVRALTRSCEPVMWLVVFVGAITWSPLATIGAGIAATIAVVATIVTIGNFVVAQRRDVFGRAERQLRDVVAEYAPEVILYFSASSAASLYQLRQWIPTVVAAQRRAMIITRERKLLRPLSALHREIPAVWVSKLADLDDISGEAARVVLYVNNGMKNAHMLRIGRLTHVQMLHGESDKGASANPMTSSYNKIFVAGQLAIDRYERAGIEIAASRFVVVGRPSTDVIDGPRELPDIPTVLYAPTWEGLDEASNSSSVRDFGCQIIERVTALDPPVRLLVKMHPLTGSNDRSLLAVVARMRDLIDRAEAAAPDVGHGWVGNATDIVTAFNESDLLISDVSSVIADYLASRKPMFVCDAENIGRDETWERYPTSGGGWIVPPSFDGFDEALRGALGDDPMRAQRAATRTYVLGDFDGDATDHFRSVIDRLVDEADPAAEQGAVPADVISPQAAAAPAVSEEPAEPLYTHCPVCAADDLVGCRLKNGKRSRVVTRCSGCGLVGLEARGDAAAINSTPGERLGTRERPGREHAMALVGLDLVDGERLRVLRLQPGVSADAEHIARLARVDRVDDLDLADLDLAQLTHGDGERWDLIIGNEVLQGADPASVFGAIADRLAPGGVAILSTDLRDGSGLAPLRFPYVSTNTWYWAPETIATQAERAGLFWDVRMPAIAVRRRALRKRYVLLAHDHGPIDRAAAVFGRQLHARSEVAQ